ncbi:MAG: hypothetical protein ACYSUN_10000, partial [Planctomycetota bacterium]
GKGDGSSAATSRGSLGQRVLPTDYTRGTFKGGGDAASLVRSLRTGLHGTSMPSFEMALREMAFRDLKSAPSRRAVWHLAHFIQRQAGPVKGTPQTLRNLLR